MVARAAQDPRSPEIDETSGFPVIFAFKLNPPSITPDLLKRPVRPATPYWSRHPSIADVARAFPPAAMRQRLSGSVDMTCELLASGRLLDLAWRRRIPPNLGFEAAALKPRPRFKLSCKGCGRAVGGGTIHIPISFVLPGRR